ncbi:hypothetical protein MIMGU_mgv1a005331mg [Erythranthe guttata]|uniref:Bromo domain-containing protein n=1 Tax=Erythranthe guttata TaxID=4155 RepID=A0A022RL34_ERYGU|nr:hypothetical protein MIMGU_mgv1a005331mg [Erythranthe guttata]
MLGGGNEGLTEEDKLSERKVYSRRPSFKGIENSNLSMEQPNVEAVAMASGFDLGPDNFVRSKSDKVRISLSMKSKREAVELRRKLEGERDMIRSLMTKIEADEGRRVAARKFDNQLSVSVCDNSNAAGVIDNLEKEKKRTPKANKMYRNSEFLLAKDKIPSAESNKKSKSNAKKGGGASGQGVGVKKFPNPPVDAVGLGLHDYFEIIRNPMDLGTVKDRLAQNWYKSPMEFAEDVRLTFKNALTYNPKEQDVYLMADQLLKIFEDKWPVIEADYMRESRPNMKKTADRSESTNAGVDPLRKTMSVAQTGKVFVKKKPKAKESNKREMTYEEKQKLSINLQNLPSEKLENVVQIIKKRNPSVSQQDDEIEVDIDVVDTETLWELDRFVTNYKKGLSKNKRKADTVTHVVTDVEQNTNEKIANSIVTESAKESRADEEKVASPPAVVEEPNRNETKRGASQSSSGSDSGSSSSGDSDGESSSVDGSDGGR